MGSEKSRTTARARRLWTFFRLTPEELEKIKEFQRTHPLFRLLLGQHLGTDHNHASGLIRGCLDWRINRAYGLLEKVAPGNLSAVLRALAEYHDNPPAVTALGAPRYGIIGIAKHKRKMVYGPPSTTRQPKRSRNK